jgi:hypothetical protein
MSYDNFNPGTDLETFRAKMANLQPPNKYMVQFFKTGLGLISVYPDSITLPTIEVQPMEYSVWGNPVLIPVTTLTGEMTVSFILLDDWEIRTYFENWLKMIQEPSFPGAVTRAPSAYENAYGSGTVTFYNNAKPKTYNIPECYPLNLTPIEFSASSSGYTIFTVVFYTRNIQADINLGTTTNIQQNQTIQ